MHYIIDGHNLIGQCRTIKLADPDDEAKLTELLHRWLLRRPKATITVVFDRGVYGHPQALARTNLKVIFEHSPRDADTRILHLITSAPPRQVTVVTADRRVVDAARSHGVLVVPSPTFAAQLEQPPAAHTRGRPRRQRPEPKLPRSEVDQWLRMFGADEEPE